MVIPSSFSSSYPSLSPDTVWHLKTPSNYTTSRQFTTNWRMLWVILEVKTPSRWQDHFYDNLKADFKTTQFNSTEFVPTQLHLVGTSGKLTMTLAASISVIIFTFTPFPPFFLSVIYFSHKRSAWIRKPINIALVDGST